MTGSTNHDRLHGSATMRPCMDCGTPINIVGGKKRCASCGYASYRKRQNKARAKRSAVLKASTP